MAVTKMASDTVYQSFKYAKNYSNPNQFSVKKKWNRWKIIVSKTDLKASVPVLYNFKMTIWYWYDKEGKCH